MLISLALQLVSVTNIMDCGTLWQVLLALSHLCVTEHTLTFLRLVKSFHNVLEFEQKLIHECLRPKKYGIRLFIENHTGAWQGPVPLARGVPTSDNNRKCMV